VSINLIGSFDRPSAICCPIDGALGGGYLLRRLARLTARIRNAANWPPIGISDVHLFDDPTITDLSVVQITGKFDLALFIGAAIGPVSAPPKP